MAQTIRYWNPGSTDPTLNASYHDGVGGASAAPGTSNIVYVAQGNDRISGHATAWDQALAYVSVTPGFGGNIGGQGQSMVVGANTNSGSTQYGTDGSTASGVEKFDFAAKGGTSYIAAGTGGIDVVRVKTGGKLYLTSGTLNTRVELTSGELDIGASFVLSSTGVELYGGTSNVEYKADATQPTLKVYDGYHVIKRAMGATEINGGHVVIDVHGEANAFDGALTVNGGTLEWRSGSVGATQINFLGGQIVFSKATQPISLASASLIVVAGSKVDEFSPFSSKVTWPASTAIQIKAAGAGIARVAAATV